MSLKGYIIRAIIAIIVCFLAVALFHAFLAAFLPAVATDGQVRFLDLCVYVLGVLYVIFGSEITYFNGPRV